MLYWALVNKIHTHKVTYCRGKQAMDAKTFSILPHVIAILMEVSAERGLPGWLEQEEQGQRRKLNENIG